MKSSDVRKLGNTELSELVDIILAERHKRSKKAFKKEHLGKDLFRRLKYVPASEGHKHKFRRDSIYHGGMGHHPPKIYDCDCGTTVYHCETCSDFVSGHPYEEKYDTIEALAGSKGVDYKCALCGSVVGGRVDTMS